MPAVPVKPRNAAEVATHVSDLIETIQDPEAEISLVVKRTKLIETRRVLTRIAIADPTVADVAALDDQPNSRLINLYGRKFGTTSLTLWDADNKPVTFLIRVTLDTRDLEARIRQLFPGANVFVRQSGSQVILEGQVADAKTMSDVLQVVTMELAAAGAQQMLSGGGMGGGGAAGGMGGGMGQGMGQGSTSLTATSTGTVSPYAIINRVHVPGPRQVMLHVKIAELNRTALRELGISWLNPQNSNMLASTIGTAANIGSQANLGQATRAIAGHINPVASTFNATSTALNTSNATLYGIFHAGHFSLFLDALRSNALAKILAEPTLLALDGQPARFLAGGLFPYPVPQSSSIPGGTAVVTVQFANFGAILSFLPQILANDVIRLDVEPVFSQLNFGAGTTINGGQVPAIDQRSARTVVELREGQTLAIAGLLQSTTNAKSLRIPGLGDLPIVGPWFSFTQVQTIETELVVLVTPELVAPMEPGQVPEAPGDRVLQPNDFEFFFLGRIESRLGRDFRATVRQEDPLNVMKHFQSEDQWVIGPHGHAD